jgi:hypothetical protein
MNRSNTRISRGVFNFLDVIIGYDIVGGFLLDISLGTPSG